MKERPILFSAPMVRALIDGTKTQTRRIVKGTPLEWLQPGMFAPGFVSDPANHLCPYGDPGDRLWVRETWSQPTTLDPGPTIYRADYPTCVPAGFTNLPAIDEITWKPSIHMFRKDSRITLEVTGVRVERLQDISEGDATAEGIRWTGCNKGQDYYSGFSYPPGVKVHIFNPSGAPTAVEAYRHLWESINGTGSWDANPWVWVVEFKPTPTDSGRGDG